MDQTDSNLKMIAGFLAGVLFAGGGVYMLTKKPETAAPAKAVVTAAAPAVSEHQTAPAAALDSHQMPVPAIQPPEPVKKQSIPATHQIHSPVTEKKIMAKVEEPKTKSEPTPVSVAPVPQPVQVQPPPPVPAVAVEQPRPAPKPREPSTVTIPAGTLVAIRLSEAISSEKKLSNDPFTAVLSEPLVVNGFVIAERGARAEGRLVDVTRAGKVKGLAHLALELTSFLSADGQRVKVQTALFEKDGPSSKKKDAGKVAAAAGIGAIIGGVIGGGKGAVIGAGTGGGAAEGAVLLTRGEPAVLPVETRISFRMTDPVTLTERLN